MVIGIDRGSKLWKMSAIGLGRLVLILMLSHIRYSVNICLTSIMIIKKRWEILVCSILSHIKITSNYLGILLENVQLLKFSLIYHLIEFSCTRDCHFWHHLSKLLFLFIVCMPLYETICVNTDSRYLTVALATVLARSFYFI